VTAGTTLHHIAVLAWLQVVFAHSTRTGIGAGPSALEYQLLVVFFAAVGSHGIGEHFGLVERHLV